MPDTVELIEKLPDFAQAAHVAELLKPGRLAELKPGAYSKTLRLSAKVNDTEFGLSVVTEFYPAALDIDNIEFFFPIEIGVVIEKPGLSFDSSPKYRDHVLGELILY